MNSEGTVRYVMVDDPSFLVILAMKVKLLNSNSQRGWSLVTPGYCSLIIVEETKSSTFILYGISRQKILTKTRIIPCCWFSKMSTHFGTYKNPRNDDMSFGISFPPDGSIDIFQKKIEAIQKKMVAPLKIRPLVKAISTKEEKDIYVPVSSIIKTNLKLDGFVMAIPRDFLTEWSERMQKFHNMPAQRRGMDGRRKMNPGSIKQQRPMNFDAVLTKDSTKYLTYPRTDSIMKRRTFNSRPLKPLNQFKEALDTDPITLKTPKKPKKVSFTKAPLTIQPMILDQMNANFQDEPSFLDRREKKSKVPGSYQELSPTQSRAVTANESVMYSIDGTALKPKKTPANKKKGTGYPSGICF